MADIGDFLASYYDDVDRDMLIAGIILHDVGKTIELSGPIATRYTLEGRLIGHLVICANEIHEAAIKLNIDKEKAILLEHMILAHHGEKEYGSPVVPMTKEAFMLHAIDDLDAKMNMISKGCTGVTKIDSSVPCSHSRAMTSAVRNTPTRVMTMTIKPGMNIHVLVLASLNHWRGITWIDVADDERYHCPLVACHWLIPLWM